MLRHLHLFFLFTLVSCASFPSKMTYTNDDFKCEKRFDIYDRGSFEILFNHERQVYCDQSGKCINSMGARNESFEKSLKNLTRLKNKNRIGGNTCFNFVDKLDDANYLVETSIVRNESSSWLRVFLSGVTLTIIPGHSELNYNYNITITDLKTSKKKSKNLNHVIDSWYGFFLLPFAPFYSETEAADKLNVDLEGHILKELQSFKE